MKQQLIDFAKKNAWNAKMSQGGLDSYDNYSGPDLGDLVVVAGRNRDSETLTESNFASALEMLGGESDTVQVHRFGHWGCGWFELILVDPKDEMALQIAYNIQQALADYPVLDDSDYSERESEQTNETLDNNGGEFRSTIAEYIGADLWELTDEDLKELDTVVSVVFNEDVSYHGLSDAWVTDSSIERAANQYEMRGLADQGNMVALTLVESQNKGDAQ